MGLHLPLLQHNAVRCVAERIGLPPRRAERIGNTIILLHERTYKEDIFTMYFCVSTVISYALCKISNSNIFSPCLMQVHYACSMLSETVLTLLYDHATLNFKIASSLLSLSRLQINVWTTITDRLYKSLLRSIG